MTEIVKILSKMHLHVEKNTSNREQITDFSRLWIEQTKNFSRASHAIIIKPPDYEDGVYALTWLWLLYSKSVRDLIQWSLRYLSDPQALSSTLASLRMLKSRDLGSLKMRRDLGLGL